MCFREEYFKRNCGRTSAVNKIDQWMGFKPPKFIYNREKISYKSVY